MKDSHHLVATPHEYGYCAGVGTLLDEKHLVPRGAEGYYTHYTSLSELFRSQVLESRDDVPISRNCNELEQMLILTCVVRWRVSHTSISGPPTHQTAGSSFYINKWFASLSKPH